MFHGIRGQQPSFIPTSSLLSSPSDSLLLSPLALLEIAIMFRGWTPRSSNADESTPRVTYSDIEHKLNNLGKRLWPAGDSPNEKAERRLMDWDLLRKNVYSRVCSRTGQEGRRVILDELNRLLKAAGRDVTYANLPSFFGHFATARKATSGNHEEREVLVESDGTVVGYLDTIHDIVHEDKEYDDYAKLEKGVRAIWVNEEKEICPFWGLMTQTERLSVLSELDHVVSAIEQFNAPLGVDERRKLLRTSLTTLRKQSDEFRMRRVRPQIYEHHGGARHDVSYYASLSHPLLGQPLSPRRARIYGL
ncbi:hypothetical protein NBRC10512_002107 [Rhodotorula toruloides]|uniref:RHTO0S18e00254g1_1 n=2 Tax=Rhodotorula toruloides TaxID=5286 RepID=A0A061BEN9_RHOTO|nr:uncharacterized protein RHTO_01839 [Rhodotorula toruloides NP11]EMS21373.1 hypothetical protein RHTO_01839 [Rhodotorula toruloides NP11]CDR48447.1 RHTO0S18e00254g1_1 [Rhodotorula toruloides]